MSGQKIWNSKFVFLFMVAFAMATAQGIFISSAFAMESQVVGEAHKTSAQNQVSKPKWSKEVLDKAAPSGKSGIVSGTTSYTLTVSNSGGGTVTSSDGNLNCTSNGINCYVAYTPGSSVTLTATPSTGYSFSGWSGDCSGTGTCSLSMTSNKSAQASFQASGGSQWFLSVTPVGGGAVTSSDGQINCRADTLLTSCTGYFNNGQYATLTATADSGHSFTGWGGSCSGSNATCSVTNSSGSAFSGSVSVTATFVGGTSSGYRVVNDFDGDGKSDILMRHSTSSGNAILFMNGSSISSSQSLYSASVIWQVAGVGDFNSDGKSDILWRYTNGGSNIIWLISGYTVSSYGSLDSLDGEWQMAGVGDFNGDSKDDLFWRNTTTGVNSVWLMDGLTVLSSANTDIVNVNWSVVGVGDFDGDGKADLLWRNNSTGEDVVWYMNGVLKKSGLTLLTVPVSWQVAGVGDFDGDGVMDILWRNSSSGKHVVWIMTESGYSLSDSGIIGTLADLNWTIAEVGDFDGNGKADILLRNSTNGKLAMWLMNGASISGSAFVGQVSDTGWQVIPAGGKAGGTTSPDVAKAEVK